MQEINKTIKKETYPGLLIPRLISAELRSADLQTVKGYLSIMADSQLQKVMEILKKKELLSGSDQIYHSAGQLNGLMIINAATKLVIKKVLKSGSSLQENILNDHLINEIGEFNFQHIKTLLHQTYELEQLPDKVELFNEAAVVNLLLENPALKNYQELFFPDNLKTEPAAFKFLLAVEVYFRDLDFPYSEDDLISFLQKPFQLFPDSIKDQVEYIRDNWSEFLGDFMNILLTGLDIIKEEQKVWLGGPGEIKAYDFSLSDEEYERFSQDSAWMPHLVLIAKSTYVWLDQLSKKYERSITKLNEIPDEELQTLASRGFTGLWFIGVWQRSHASQKIKHLSGSTDVIASAYSLADYRIASELGGEDAMHDLQYRAGRYGIRIACDMVPNHMGLDSDWIVDHPDWFLQLPHPPYPSYSFNGQNLTDRQEIEVFLEDHYYEKSDAAVVYKLYDRRDGRSRYIYHGNDGTGIPWNDTAQLNYLLPEVREAIIQNIIRIAKQFPIIRFDAAMTLAKKHIHRLWFPQPGSGGDIASRAQYGLSKEEFDQLLPVEFWREVVDRVAEEAPRTLLLAEAFWMMEGYFVRTLGMHRVYNSAFMNMLKNEDNAKYRKSIYNIIEFNPEILKRFVNFMSNPDEDTAIAQFGKDDKYFGVCLVMSTMPGLPMFAHGQIEGFTERYGMEFPKARWEEYEDKYLVQRHQREIFPLLKKRIIFSEVQNFLLFDFQAEEGYVNENVFAYTNENRNERSLVVYNNKFENTRGNIHWANTVIKENDETVWIRKNLGDALHLNNGSDHYLIFRDQISGLEYIRNCAEIYNSGLFQELGAFKYAAYLDFREVKDDADRKYAELSRYLQGGGVPDINISFKKLAYRDIHEAFRMTVGPDILKQLQALLIKPVELKKFLPELEYRLNIFINVLKEEIFPDLKTDKILPGLIKKLYLLMTNDTFKFSEHKLLITWLPLMEIACLDNDPDQISNQLLQEIMLANEIIEINGLKYEPSYITELFELLVKYETLLDAKTQKECWQNLQLLFQDQKVRKIIGVNRFNNIDWFNLELLQEFMQLLILVNSVSFFSGKKLSKTAISKFEKMLAKINLKLPVIIKESGYELEKFITQLS